MANSFDTSPLLATDRTSNSSSDAQLQQYIDNTQASMPLLMSRTTTTTTTNNNNNNNNSSSTDKYAHNIELTDTRSNNNNSVYNACKSKQRDSLKKFIKLPAISNSSAIAIINKLPTDILLRIFKCLDVASLCRSASVCKLWSELALDGSNWQRIDLFDFQINIKTSVVKPISKRCGNFLKVLSLAYCKNVDDDTLRSLTKYCHQIEQLNLTGCLALTDNIGGYLAERCPKLRKLYLEGCVRITDTTLRRLGSGCNHLDLISLSHCDKITNEGLYQLTTGCTNLSVLRIDYCQQIDDTGLRRIAPHCTHLSQLYLTFCILVTDVGIRSICENCSELKILSLSNCDISNLSLQLLGQHCHLLRSLDVSNCSRLTDAGFQALFMGCRDLEVLESEECLLITDVTLQSLARYCSHMKSLTLSACEQITDEGIRSLTEGDAASDTLEVLELDNCPLLTDASLDYLMYCASLTKVYLFDCQQITRPGILRLQRALPKLTVQAYFAPVSIQTQPNNNAITQRSRFLNGCRHCTLL